MFLFLYLALDLFSNIPPSIPTGSTILVQVIIFCEILFPPIIVAKKRDPGILDPELFLAQIRKVEARIGKLAKIRKVETDQESSSKRLGKLEVRPKKKKKKVLAYILFGNQESLTKLGKLGWDIRKLRKVHLENQESSLGKLGKKLGRQESSFGKLGKK